MARSRTHPSLLEQSRRHWRWLAIAAAALVLAAAILFWPRNGETTAVPLSVAPVPSGQVTVEVLNGTRRQGAARAATRILRRQGLDVVFLGNADSLADSTRVVARRGDVARARHVASALGSGLVLVETDTFRRVDVTVILGEDFRPAGDLHP
jgi:LytR cell envelope-related transcriptional attenuator